MAGAAPPPPVLTAQVAGLWGCPHCALAWPAGTPRCGRCGAPLHARDRRSLRRVWLWWALGLVAFVPAMATPMLVTRTLFGTSDATLVGGAVTLLRHGSPGVAAVILLASVLLPLAKLGSVAWLALSVQRRRTGSRHGLMRLFHLVEFIGRWSMVDVFVVAILSALVKVPLLVSVTPGPAALAFALSVVCTMLAARSFDSRLIWDSLAPPPARR